MGMTSTQNGEGPGLALVPMHGWPLEMLGKDGPRLHSK